MASHTEPVTKTVWAFNGRSSDATVIDTTTQKSGWRRFRYPGKPEFPGRGRQGQTSTTTSKSKNEIVRFDAAAKKITAEWPVCDSPSGLAIDTAAHPPLLRLRWQEDGGSGRGKTGKVLATPRDWAMARTPAGFDAKDKVAFSSNGRWNPDRGRCRQPRAFPSSRNLTTQKGARTMTFDSANGRIYLTTRGVWPPAPQLHTAGAASHGPRLCRAASTVLVVGSVRWATEMGR